MPYSLDSKLLFIHIPKTGGKSIETALGFVSPSESTKYHWRTLLNRGLTWAQRRTADARAPSRLWGIIDYALMAQHVTYAEVCLLGLVSRTALVGCTKFAVCRNPYDRAVSVFYHLEPTARREPKAFEAFLRTWLDEEPATHSIRALRRPQWQYCVDLNGHMAMDAILRFESLTADMNKFAHDVLGQPITLPWVGRQRHDRDYTGFYSASSRRLVREAFEGDFEMFEYTV